MKLIKEFVANEVQPEHGYWIVGTVELELNGKTKTIEAWLTLEKDGSVKWTEIKGIAYRYYTGKKLWCGDLILWPNGNFQMGHAGYHGQIRQRAPQVVGFWDDYSDAVKSKG